MTKKEYVQSLKDKGVKKSEALELLNQWDIDNKTEVEKPQATATDAALVVASPIDSTESISENTSSESTESSNPEVEKPKKKNKNRKKYFVANDNGKMITFKTKLEYNNWVDGVEVDVESEDEIPVSKIGLFGRVSYNKKSKESRKLTEDNKTIGNKEKARGKANVVETYNIDSGSNKDLTKIKVDDIDYDVVRYDKLELPDNMAEFKNKKFENNESVKICLLYTSDAADE